MRQAYIPYTEEYEEDDTPLEGKKSCMAEAYSEGFYDAPDNSSEVKLLN